jgi:hypothetical protein
MHGVGTPVAVRLDTGKVRITKTRSPAWTVGGHTDVVLLEGITGCYLLDRVSPLGPDADRPPATRVLMFRPRFATPIQAGTKRQTVREKTAALPGELISPRIWSGRPYRSIQIPLIAPARCLSVVPIRIEADWFSSRLNISILGNALARREVKAFARADGFESVTDMVSYYHGRKVEAFDGVLIQWSPQS